MYLFKWIHFDEHPNRRLSTYFYGIVKENNDSPLALDVVTERVRFVFFEHIAAMNGGSTGEIYAALFNRLKSTSEGIELKQKIDQNKLK